MTMMIPVTKNTMRPGEEAALAVLTVRAQPVLAAELKRAMGHEANITAFYNIMLQLEKDGRIIVERKTITQAKCIPYVEITYSLPTGIAPEVPEAPRQWDVYLWQENDDEPFIGVHLFERKPYLGQVFEFKPAFHDAYKAKVCSTKSNGRVFIRPADPGTI